MQDDKIRQKIEDSLKPQRDINNFVVMVIVAIIPSILAAAGRIALDVAWLFVITILIIYLGWLYINNTRIKSIIDWRLFYTRVVDGRFLMESAESLIKGKQYNKNLAVEDYNNYILFLYLAALYEGKEKFAQELWDKARISDEFYKEKQIK